MANLLSKYVVPGCRVDLQEIEHTELDDEMDEGYTLRTAGRGYQSKVLDILSEDKIEVLMPMEKSRVVTLPVDGEYDLYFFTEMGLYQCCLFWSGSASLADGRIKETHALGGIPGQGHHLQN